MSASYHSGRRVNTACVQLIKMMSFATLFNQLITYHHTIIKPFLNTVQREAAALQPNPVNGFLLHYLQLLLFEQ